MDNKQQIKEIKELYKKFLEKKSLKDILTKVINTKGNNYSIKNFLWCWCQADNQNIDFTGILKGFLQFKKDNIMVNRGSKALKILIPCFTKIEKENPKTQEIEEKDILSYFRLGNVFDISQTNSLEYQEVKKEKDIKIYSNTTDLNFNDVLEFVKNNFEYDLIINENINSGCKGYFKPLNNEIVIFRKDSHTLLHEFSHFLTSDILGKDKNKTDYAKNEIIAEVTAFLISKKLGRKEYNFNYSNCWANNLKNFEYGEFERYYKEIIKRIEKLNYKKVLLCEV